MARIEEVEKYTTPAQCNYGSLRMGEIFRYDGYGGNNYFIKTAWAKSDKGSNAVLINHEAAGMKTCFSDSELITIVNSAKLTVS